MKTMGQPPRTSAGHEAWNDLMARRYDPDAFITRSGFLIRWVASLRLRRIRETLDCGENSSLLDVGCGPGNLIAGLSAGEIVGLDLSDTLLGQAREKLKNRRGMRLIKGDAEKLPFPDDRFDRIVCSEVLEHVREPARALSEIRRVAKPGARIVLTIPNEALISRTKKIVLALRLKGFVAKGYAMSDEMREEWHVHEFTRDSLLNLTRGAFRLLRCEGVPFPFFAYHHLFLLKVEKIARQNSLPQ